jgi:stress-induced morphogen
MMITAQEIETRIKKEIDGAEVVIKDMTGGQDHWDVEVVSETFAGVSPVNQHRMVYAAFTDVMGGALHALKLKTRAP